MSGNRKYQQLCLADLEQIQWLVNLAYYKVTFTPEEQERRLRIVNGIGEAITRAREIQKQTTKPVRVCLAYSVQRSAQLTMIPPANVKALSRK